MILNSKELRVSCRNMVTMCRECKTRHECVDFGLERGCALLEPTVELIFDAFKGKYVNECQDGGEFEL